MPNKRPRLDKASERPAKALKSALKPSAPSAPTASTSKSASQPARKPAKPKPAAPAALLPPEPSDQPFDAFRIVAGSYERILVGLVGRFVLEEGSPEPQLRLTPIFNFPAHLSCIKTCAALDSSPPASNIPGAPKRKRQRAWLATAGTDETVKIWDLGRRREVGSLVASTGVVTKLAFASRNLLIAVSADATMSLYSTEDPAWSLLRTLKGHMGRINDVAVHPAGRIALSVGQDRCLRMWDLFGSRSKGASGGKEGASSTKLGAEADAVQWSPDGSRFALILINELRVFSTVRCRAKNRANVAVDAIAASNQPQDAHAGRPLRHDRLAGAHARRMRGRPRARVRAAGDCARRSRALSPRARRRDDRA